MCMDKRLLYIPAFADIQKMSVIRERIIKQLIREVEQVTERLTDKNFRLGFDDSNKLPSYEAIYERLRKYETAEDKGRLVVLPCKVGDVLYKPTRSFISEYKIRFIEVSSCNCLFLHTNVIKGINDTGELFKEDDIGKIVFLTREEAEKALKEMEGNHE